MIKQHSPDSDPIPNRAPIHATVYAMGQTDPATGAWMLSPLDSIVIGSHLVRPGLLVVKMDNASMEPIIRRNAYVGIDCRDRELRNGVIYALNIIGEGLTLRRVLRDQGDGAFAMQAENPALPTQRCPAGASGLTPVGKVVWVIQEI